MITLTHFHFHIAHSKLSSSGRDTIRAVCWYMNEHVPPAHIHPLVKIVWKANVTEEIADREKINIYQNSITSFKIHFTGQQLTNSAPKHLPRVNIKLETLCVNTSIHHSNENMHHQTATVLANRHMMQKIRRALNITPAV